LVYYINVKISHIIVLAIIFLILPQQTAVYEALSCDNDRNSVQLCSNVEQVAANSTPQMLWYTLHKTW